MRRARFFFLEAVRSIRANVAVAIAAITTVAIAIFVLGAFIPSFLVVQSTVDDQRDRVDVRAYVADEATVAQVKELEDAIIDMQPGGARPELVETYIFVDKDDALQRMRERLEDPSILEELTGNPFPRSFDIKPENPERSQEVIDELSGFAAIHPDEGIADGGELTDRLLRVANFIQWTGLGLIIILSVASLLLIANTIRLSIFARRREVEIMRLVGGTNWFIRWPFIIEGVICGLIGALLSVALLYAVKIGVVDQWLSNNDNSLERGTATAISFGSLALILIAAGAIVGALGSGLTIRRFLKV